MEDSNIIKNDNNIDNNNNSNIDNNNIGGGEEDINVEKILKRKEKEREAKLASMMSHYHQKYSSPSLPSSPIVNNNNNDNNNNNNNIDTDTSFDSGLNNNNDNDEDDEFESEEYKQSLINRKALLAARKKELLAEQMKKYNEKYDNIISGVNTILSPTASSTSLNSLSSTSQQSSNNSSLNTSPVLFSQQPHLPTSTSNDSIDFDQSQSQHNNNIQSPPTPPTPPQLSQQDKEKQQQEYFSKKEKEIKARQQQQLEQLQQQQKETERQQEIERQLIEQQEIENRENQLFEKQQQSQQSQQSQQHATLENQQPISPQQSQQPIPPPLLFEKNDIPLLTNVGFVTLKNIELNAIKCSEEVVLLTKTLNQSLSSITKISIELFETFKGSTELTCGAVTNSVNETKEMIDKCFELNNHTKSVISLHKKIKLVKDQLDKFDQIIHNAVKQLDKK